MATAKLFPGSYTLSNTQYLTISDASNMYHDTSNTTYATITHTRASTNSTYYLYIHNFDFSTIPSEATVSSSSSYKMSLYNGTTSISNTTASTALSTTVQTITIPVGSLTWSTLSGYGNNFRIRVPLRRASSNTADVLYVYGAEIEVTYTVPNPRTFELGLEGEGTISPTAGTYTKYDGDSVTITITPTDTSEEVTAIRDGTDITSQLVPHYNSTSSLSQTAASYTTELSASGANFYTSSSATGNYFNYAVGHTAESPGSTSTSYNTYVKDNGSNTATGWAWYTFDFSSIPADAMIDSIEVKCYGACESTTHDSTHKANITLYSGNTLKSTEQYFTSTSNATITISSPGTWTRSELQNARLKFEVAYYGGRLFFITCKVNYSVPQEHPDYYTYSFTVSGNTSIEVTIGSSAVLYFKNNGSWIAVMKAYRKVNGSWVEMKVKNVFDSQTNYVKN